MKDEFIYVDGRVIPHDEKDGLYTSYEYQDNIHDIFITEDIIEGLEKDLKELVENKLEVEKIVSKNTKWKIFAPLFWCSILSLFLPTLINNIFGGSNPIVLGNMKYTEIFTLMAWPVYTVIGGIFTFENYVKANKAKKTLSAIYMEEEFLNKSINKYKEEVIELKKDKSKDNENMLEENEITRINYKEYLNVLKDALLMCRSLGYKKEYSNEFKEEKVKEVEEFVDNKFKTLKKRK